MYEPKTREQLEAEIKLLERITGAIKDDEANGKTQLFFVPHIPADLLKSFKDKVVEPKFNGKMEEALIFLMKESVKKADEKDVK